MFDFHRITLLAVKLFFCSMFLGLSVSAEALSPAVEQLVKWETEANAVAKRSPVAVKLEHYEVPMKILQTDFATDKLKYYNAFVIEKNGEKYVRWVINPEDTQWYVEFEKWLSSKGVASTRHQHFIGYQTASRSYIVEDPSTGLEFSLKMSTNRTGGSWTNKKQEWIDARDIRYTSDYIREGQKRIQLKDADILLEPAAFGAAEIDQGIVVRDLGGLTRGDRYYLPGFSALEENVGREIALKNGATSVTEFWEENYMKPLGRALAEYQANFGLAFDSPHSQNFLIELDKNMKPTGRIILRDLGDTYLTREFLEAVGRTDILKSYSPKQILKGAISGTSGVLHGNKAPSWLSPQDYEKWQVSYHEAYANRLSELTGVPVSEIKSVRHMTTMFSYSSKSIPTTSAAWKAYFSNSKHLHSVVWDRDSKEIPNYISNRMKPSFKNADCTKKTFYKISRM